jgi:Uma2 family endonuclease
MAMATPDSFTADDVRALPDDGKRYETVHGELLVTPAPGGLHQPVLMRLIVALTPYLISNGRIAELLTAPADITFGLDSLVQPDLFVADTRAFLHSGDWRDVTTLHLVIEILSPSTVRADRVTKRRLYQERGIAEYWVVDIEQRQVEVWTPEARSPRVERERLVWRHPELKAECAIEVKALLKRG